MDLKVNVTQRWSVISTQEHVILVGVLTILALMWIYYLNKRALLNDGLKLHFLLITMMLQMV